MKKVKISFLRKNLEKVEVTINKHFLIFITGVWAFLFLGSVGLICYYISKGFDIQELQNLRKDNKMFADKFEELNNKVRLLTEKLKEMSKLNNELRASVNLPANKNSDLFLGVGGTYSISNPEKSNASIYSAETNSKLQKLEAELSQLDRILSFQDKEMEEISKKIESNKLQIRTTPTLHPLLGHGYFSSRGFGYHSDPITGESKMHSGQDIVAPIGTKVYSTAEGTVITAEYLPNYGNTIVIKHNAQYTTLYAHLSKIAVRNGEKVKKGDLIGYVGNTGKSTGSHLHYEVRLRGVCQNPKKYILF